MIYYLLDTTRRLLKIGCSANPVKRVGVLQARRTDTLLLAVEPGSFDRERHQHATFATLRMTGEWFNYSGALKTYVEGLAIRCLGRDEIDRMTTRIDVALLPASNGVRVVGRHVFGWADESSARLIYCGAIPVRMTVEREGRAPAKWCWNCHTIIVVPQVAA